MAPEPFIRTPVVGYHFNQSGIERIESIYNAKYLGYWCTKKNSGSWNETPIDIFWVENPDTSKGHTNFFGMFVQGGYVLITNGESAFSEPITGVLTNTGQVIVSRYRHDYVEVGPYMIDGGRDYTRSSGVGDLVSVTIVDGNFVISKI